MNCLDRDSLSKIKTQKEWKEVESKYRDHCSYCNYLLEIYNKEIDRKELSLDRLNRELISSKDARESKCGDLDATNMQEINITQLRDNSEDEWEKVITSFAPGVTEKISHLCGAANAWWHFRIIMNKLFRDIINERIKTSVDLEKKIWEYAYEEILAYDTTGFYIRRELIEELLTELLAEQETQTQKEKTEKTICGV